LWLHRLHLGLVAEGEGNGVEAVAEPGGWRAILKDMAEVASATNAEDLGPDHAVGDVAQFGDVLSGEGLVKARPAGSGMELRPGGKKRQVAARAEVNAGLVIVQEVAAEGCLGSLGAQDTVGGGPELLLPLRVGLHHAGHLGDRTRFAIGSDESHGDSGRGGIGGLCHGSGGVATAADHGEEGCKGQEVTGAHGETIA